jgi:hypothetical protein
MENKTYRCFIFDERQEMFLRDKRYKIDRMGCFMSLVDKVARVPILVDISNHRQVRLEQGQFVVNDIELSHLWKLDRETVGKLMKRMEELGMFTATKVAEVTVYSIHVFSGWIDNGYTTINQFYRKPPKPGDPQGWKIPEVNQIFTRQMDKVVNKGICPVYNCASVRVSSSLADSEDNPRSNKMPTEQSTRPIGQNELPPASHLELDETSSIQ